MRLFTMRLLIASLITFTALATPAFALEESLQRDVVWLDGLRYDYASAFAFDNIVLGTAHGADREAAWRHTLPAGLTDPGVRITRVKLILTAVYPKAGVPYAARVGSRTYHWAPGSADTVSTVIELPIPKRDKAFWSTDALEVSMPATDLDGSGIRLVEARLLIQYDDRPEPVFDPSRSLLRAAAISSCPSEAPELRRAG
jgi:hypothetical protein